MSHAKDTLWKIAVHAGPAGVDQAVTKLHGQNGFGFDVFSGTERFYLSLFRPSSEDALDVRAYVLEELRRVLGYRPNDIHMKRSQQ